MAQGTYIGQAQINTQKTYDDYNIGDIVVFKSDRSSNKTKYLVEGFDGNKAILRAMEKHTWMPNREWFIKEEQ